MQPVGDLVADKAYRRGQTLQGALGFLLIAADGYQDPRRTGITGEFDATYAGKADAGIGEFAFHDGFDFFAQRLSEPAAMILLTTTFHCFSSE
jgi:hypothetical protein